MNKEEANKIIAEYMGYYFIGVEKKRIEDLPCLILTRMSDGERVYKYPYSESLDALVPVWEKIGKVYLHLVPQYNEIHIEVGEIEIGFAKGKTIQEAACIATARAIEALTDSDLQSSQGRGENE